MTVIQDQAESLRQLVLEAQMDDPSQLFAQDVEPSAREEARSPMRVIAVTSGKGGVGKSNVALNLGITLSQMGQRVLLLDADLGTANADVLCNLPPSAVNLLSVISGDNSLADVIVHGPGGIRIVPGASGLASVAAMNELDRGQLVRQMLQLEADVDVLIVDTGAGVSPNVLSFVASADQQLVVTTPEPTAIADAYALIKTAHQENDELDVRLLVNMVGNSREGLQVFERIDQVCRRFLNEYIWYAGYVLHDLQVSRAVRRRQPFALESSRCNASRCVQTIAERLMTNASVRKGNWLNRLWGRLSG
jgi:flagellar biosynthesis protein FlhG